MFLLKKVKKKKKIYIFDSNFKASDSFDFFFIFIFFIATTVEEDECASEINHEYNMPMRVGALFIILGTSALGIYISM